MIHLINRVIYNAPKHIGMLRGKSFIWVTVFYAVYSF